MKNKLTKIFAVIALVLIAPIGIILTGCGEKDATLTAKSTNNTVLYVGETLEEANWEVEYFNGKESIDIEVTSDMVLCFDTSSVTTSEKTATIVYNNLVATQTYTVVKGTPKITAKSTNRTIFYVGETFDSVKWQFEYYDGESTTTVDVIKDMLANFDISEVKGETAASIVYNGLVATQTYSVLATPFNTSVVYESELCVVDGETQDSYYYLKISNDGKSCKLISSSDELNSNEINWDEDTQQELTFTNFGFDTNDQWTASCTTSANMGGVDVLYASLTKLNDTQLKFIMNLYVADDVDLSNPAMSSVVTFKPMI